MLRAHVGQARLLLPSVSAHVVDDAGRLLLVRQREGGIWSTPGGVVEPDERPADAVVREAWEETGLHVRPVRLHAVYGGPECVVRYPNGDETQYVIVAFGCVVVGGTACPDHDETDLVRWWTREEAAALPLAPWLRSVLPMAFADAGGPGFHAARWEPPRPDRR